MVKIHQQLSNFLQISQESDEEGGLPEVSHSDFFEDTGTLILYCTRLKVLFDLLMLVTIPWHLNEANHCIAETPDVYLAKALVYVYENILQFLKSLMAKNILSEVSLITCIIFIMNT